jgi:steroid 5-alpha reductase family enzyme
MVINVRSDERLLHFRKPEETGYKIPNGGLFQLVSCPNLLGECIEWLGFALMSWSLPGFVFFVWTCANVIPRALAHHRWYLNKFPDYPKERKAVVPHLI